MTRTRRIYNRRRAGIFIHPYRQVCMGHCPRCRDPMVAKRRRLAYAREVREVQDGVA